MIRMRFVRSAFFLRVLRPENCDRRVALRFTPLRGDRRGTLRSQEE